MTFGKIAERLRAWCVSVVRDGVAAASPPPPTQPMPGHVALMRLRAAASLVQDGENILTASAAAGVEPDDLRHWLSPRRGGKRR